MPYWTDDVKSAAKLQIFEPLTEKTWERVWAVFEVSNGEDNTFNILFDLHNSWYPAKAEFNNC